MQRAEIYDRVRDVLVEALGVEEDEVAMDAKLTEDLGAESIDFLDIKFQLEQAFGFKINDGELFPDNVMQDPDFIAEGRVTDKGMATLRERMPHASFDELDANPTVDSVAKVFTVEAVVNFAERKLAAAG